jgi:pyridoxal phosphate enzyme (YggS family)
MSVNLAELRDNVKEVRQRIAGAARRSGRDPADVRLMAVTKSFPADQVRIARQAGLDLFGENRVQEAQAKYEPLVLSVSADEPPQEALGPVELHLIGHLQRNKAKIAARLFRCVQSIDKPETARALDGQCAEAGTRMDVLLEVNTSGEDSKFGFRDEEKLNQTIEEVLELEQLTVRGLMTIGPFTEDRDRIRRAFAELRELYERLQELYPQLDLDVLSMGMSGDFEIAIEEGATLVRLGTALFGPRIGRQ